MYHGEDLAKASHASASGAIGTLRASASEQGPRSTLVEAIGSAEALYNNLLEHAAFAERLADAVAGAIPAGGAEAERRGPSGGLVETVAERIGQCAEPSNRIRMAMERLGRALG